MALSNDVKDRIRRHLGFPALAAINSYFLGFPAAQEPFFFLEGNMNAILPGSEARIVRIVEKLDALEEQIFDDSEALVAKEVGDIVLRDDEYEKLVQRYLHFRGDLSNSLAAPPNPFDMRFGGAQGVGGINVGVSG